MKHMKMSPEDEKEPSLSATKQEYPYGLQIHLDEKSMQKLGIKDMPKVGDKMHMEAKVHVAGAMMHDGPAGKHRSISLQITHMDVAKGGKYEETDGDTKGKKLYGDK